MVEFFEDRQRRLARVAVERAGRFIGENDFTAIINARAMLTRCC